MDLKSIGISRAGSNPAAVGFLLNHLPYPINPYKSYHEYAISMISAPSPSWTHSSVLTPYSHSSDNPAIPYSFPSCFLHHLSSITHPLVCRSYQSISSFSIWTLGILCRYSLVVSRPQSLILSLFDLLRGWLGEGERSSFRVGGCGRWRVWSIGMIVRLLHRIFWIGFVSYSALEGWRRVRSCRHHGWY